MKQNKKPTLAQKLEVLELAKEKAKTDPAVWAQLYLDFDCDPWQANFLRSKSDRIILNCSRQSGKSTSTAIIALWEALHIANSVIVVESPSFRQSIELMQKFTQYLRMLGQEVELETDTKLSTQFSNGSRVIALPGSERTIRGISAVTLMIIDEAARIDDELYKAVRPMLAVSHGRLILLSTPYGRQGIFYDVWSKGEGWEKVEVPASQCPRITKEFLAEEKAALGDIYYRQEYLCDFTAQADARIKREWLKYIDRPPLDLKIVMGIDLAISERETADYTACAILGRDEKGLLYILDMQRIRASFQQQIEFIKQLAAKWKPSVVGVEDIAYQRSMVQQLSATSDLAVKSVKPDRDKVSRFAPIESRFELGQVYLMRDLPNAFEAELLSFPAAEHDDFCDALSCCWSVLQDPPSTVLSFSTQPMTRQYGAAPKIF